MTRHVCEVWAEQGWCPHVAPDPEACFFNAIGDPDGFQLSVSEISQPDRMSVVYVLTPRGSRS